MARRPQTSDLNHALRKFLEVAEELPSRIEGQPPGEQVGALVQVHHHLRDLGATVGASLAPKAESGRARVIAYLRVQVGSIVHTDELMIVAGIGDYPRRIRELRTKEGWPILSGAAAKDLREAEQRGENVPSAMAPEEYMLIEDARDPDGPRRWSLAAQLRNKGLSPHDAVAAVFRASPRHRIIADELKQAAGEDSSWPAAVRRLRQEGWNIASRMFGADLPHGIFIYLPDPGS